MAVSIVIDIVQNSQNVANNTSNVTVKVNAKWTGGSYNLLEKSGWAKINGTTYNFTSPFNTGRTTSGSGNLFTKTLDIAHNSDGTKTLAVSASYTSGVSSGTVGASASKVLTTIARKSSLTVANGTLGTKQTLTITEQASAFTHRLYYSCGNSGDVYILGSSSTTSSALSYDWTPPLSLAAQNTTGTSVSIKFTLMTFNGSTPIGSNTYTKTFNIPASVAPTCSLSVTDATGWADDFNGYIKTISKAKVTVTPTTAQGSPIKSYKTTVDGLTYTSASFTSNVLSSSGTLTIKTTVTDARGRTGTASTTITVHDYSPPTITTFKVTRCANADGTGSSGSYLKVTYASSITAITGSVASSRLEYKKQSESTYTQLGISSGTGTKVFAADPNTTYDIRLTVADAFTGVVKTAFGPSIFKMFSVWTKFKAFAIGKIAELENVFDIALQTRFLGGILHPVLAVGTDLNDTRTPNTYVGANLSTSNYSCGGEALPLTSGTFTLAVEGMGDSGQVKQRITSCRKADARAFERIYYSSSWGEWVCVSDYAGNLLWDASGTSTNGYFMIGSQTVTLSEPVSKQRSGIVLVFSEYVDGAGADQSFHSRFIHKKLVSLHNGKAECIQLSSSNLSYFATKYLYISDTKITGHDNNNKTGTATCGITYTNNRFVLRYVIGV